MKLCQYVLLSCTGLAIALSSPAQAQDTTREKDVWQKLATHKTARFQAAWGIEIVGNPNPKFNADEALAKIENLQPQSGNPSAELVEDARQSQIASVRALRDGYTWHDQLEVTRVGSQIKAESVSQEAFRASRTIEYYDGINAVSLAETTAYLDGGKKSASLSGTVSRKNNVVLSMTLPAYVPLLLAQAPIIDKFNPDNSKMLFEGEDIMLRKAGSWDDRFPDSYTQIVLSNKDLSIKSIQEFLHPEKMSFCYEVLESAQKNGETVPIRIVSRHPGPAKPGSVETIYTASDIKLGDQVDPVSLLLPAKAHISDYRFGDEKGVIYEIKDGRILSDDQVKTLLGEREQLKQTRAEAERQTQKATVLYAFLGISLTCVGGGLWRSGKKSRA